MTTAAVVLAAGGGTRFSGLTHKLLEELDGAALVTHAVKHAMAAQLDETIVVIGAVDIRPVLPDRARVVDNARWHDGITTSLQVALDAARASGHDAVVVGLGDQPLIPPSAWAAVAASASPIAVATYGGKRGNPVRLAHDVWGLLPTTGDAGARVLMAQRPDLVGEVACEGNPADVDSADDVADLRESD